MLYVLCTAELVLVVDRHAFSLHQYADDTQVYISTPAGDAEVAVRRLTACLVDIEVGQPTSTEPHQDPGDVVEFFTTAGESQRLGCLLYTSDAADE